VPARRRATGGAQQAAARRSASHLLEGLVRAVDGERRAARLDGLQRLEQVLALVLGDAVRVANVVRG
jgi:ABC-type arginine/histidine transport system permease subunit